MAFTETGARTVHAATATTTAESVELTQPVRQVRVTNRDTDSTLYVTVATGPNNLSSAAMEAKVVTAVASADETFVVPAGQSKVVFKSPRTRKVALSVIGNTTDYSVEGTDWYD